MTDQRQPEPTDESAHLAPAGHLLEVDGLRKTYLGRASLAMRLRRRPYPRLVALDDVSLTIERNETLGIVGESGSGKTTLARCIVRLVEPDSGTVRFLGRDVLTAPPADLRAIRRQVQLIYQDPYSSLNPRLSVEAAIGEPARVHRLVDAHGEPTMVGELLDRVGLARSVGPRKPRELSGGQRQRVAIARALALRPSVVIADEAVSALDVSIQAQILNLFEDLSRELELGLIFISHQLSVIQRMAQRVAIMYMGRIVEFGPTADVFTRPRHPYTAALLEAQPTIHAGRRRAPALRGEIPSPYAVPQGCRFNTRCRFAEARCFVDDPGDAEVSTGHLVACHVLPELRQSRGRAEIAPSRSQPSAG